MQVIGFLCTWTSALRVATRVALLAAFLEDQSGLAALRTEIADAFGHGLGRRRFLSLGKAQMLGQNLGDGIRQGPNAGAAVSQMSPTPDPLKLANDLT
jgi:hypothetical protein